MADRRERVWASEEVVEHVRIGDLVRRKGGGGGHGLVVGWVETPEGTRVLVRWSQAAVFPNPSREREEALEVVRPARGPSA